MDANNGNAWVKASKDVTIYWPYPAGTNKETVFTLLHFEPRSLTHESLIDNFKLLHQ